MGAFINNDITIAGLLVLAKGQVGAPIKYTRIVLGDGRLPPDTIPRNLTKVANPVISLPISKCKVNGDGTVTVGAAFTNAQLADEFYYRELGLYAEDVDLGEVLYCYGNAGDLAERIVPGGGSTIVEKLIDIITVIGTATNVSAYIEADIYATKTELAEVVAIALGSVEVAEETKRIALEALAMSQYTLEVVEALMRQSGKDTSKIQTLWDAVFSDITGNPFQVTFADLTGIKLTGGIWSKTLHRLEC